MSSSSNFPELTTPSYSWFRLSVSFIYAVIGSIGLWSPLPLFSQVESIYSVDRSMSSLCYSVTLFGAALGSLALGRIYDQLGAFVPMLLGALSLAIGYQLIATATQFWQILIAHGVFLGLFGTSVTFSVVIADISHWFEKRRALAISIIASASYFGGALWPSFIEAGLDYFSWQHLFSAIGILCFLTLVPLALLHKPMAPNLNEDLDKKRARERHPLDSYQFLLVVAAVCCCIAMSMPQIHIIGLSSSLGFNEFVGTQMLAWMLLSGIISRIFFGFLGDYLGGLRVLLLGSGLQMLALFLFFPVTSITGLTAVCILFGSAQGGIVPSYSVIIREYFPASEAGWRIGLVLFATVLGMSLGSWMAGAIYDQYGGYFWAIMNAMLWNIINFLVVLFILYLIRKRAGSFKFSQT